MAPYKVYEINKNKIPSSGSPLLPHIILEARMNSPRILNNVSLSTVFVTLRYTSIHALIIKSITYWMFNTKPVPIVVSATVYDMLIFFCPSFGFFR